MAEKKIYQVAGLVFEFLPTGSPIEGTLSCTCENRTFSSSVKLAQLGSRAAWAKEAHELYPQVFDVAELKRALNELLILRSEEIEVAAARAAEAAEGEGAEEVQVDDSTVEDLTGTPSVLDRLVEDAARVHAVIKDRAPLKAVALGALSAQLAPLPNGKPLGTNVILTAAAGRGKNHLSDAVATVLPEDFYLKFESASAKSLYYRAENDPHYLQHKWLYPNEAEATDHLVELLRPLLSGGKAAHLTVNKDTDGRNTAQELALEGPITVTIPTVRNKLDGQLQSRMTVVELEDYEGRVAQHSRAVSRMLLPDFAETDHAGIVAGWHAALRTLARQNRRVVFPLDDERFCLDSDSVPHGARLWANFLSLMLTHAWLEQRNRDDVELASGDRAVVATPQDYEAVYHIFEVACERSVINLSDTHRKILDALYKLEADSTFDVEGFSQRKIAEEAGIHHSTVGEQKTFLVSSAKLVREVEGRGLALISGAEPSWWEKQEILQGFPRPEDVWRWWEEGGDSPPPEPTRQGRHHEEAAHKTNNNGKNGGGRPTRHSPASGGQHSPTSGNGGAGGQVAGTPPARTNGVGKQDVAQEELLAAVAGSFEETAPHPPPGGFDDGDRELLAAGWRPRDRGSTRMWNAPHKKDVAYEKEFALSRLRSAND